MVKKLLSNTVFKNFSFLTIGSVAGQLISVFTILKITGSMAPGDYGLYTFLITQGLLLVQIGNLGNTNIVIRSVARDENLSKDYLANTGLLRLLALIILTLIYLLYNTFLGSLSLSQIGLIFLFSLFNCLSYIFEWIFTGRQKILPIAVINLIYNLLWFVVVFFIPLDSIKATDLFALYLIASAVKSFLLYCTLVYHGLVKGAIKKFIKSVKQLMNESWPYLAMILVMLPLTHLTHNFLDLNSSSEEIGYFFLAQRFIGPVGLVITMLLTALFPNLAILWDKNPEKFKINVAKGFRLYMLISAFGCFVFTIFSEDLIKALFNEDYYNAILVCQIQVWYVFLTSVDSFIGTVLGATNKEKLILRFGIVYFFLCTPSLFLGSYYGAQGLSWAYVISFGIGLIYAWTMFQRKLNIRVEKEVETLLFVFGFALLAYITAAYFEFYQKVLAFTVVLALFTYYGISVFKKLKTL